MERINHGEPKPPHSPRSAESVGSEVDMNNPRLQIALAAHAFPAAADSRAAFGLWMQKDKNEISMADRFRGLRETKGYDFQVDMGNVRELDALVEETTKHPPHPTLH